MKFSTRIDTDLPAERLFEVVGNFDALERMVIGRGATVARIDPSNEPGIGMGWNIGFELRAWARTAAARPSRFDALNR